MAITSTAVDGEIECSGVRIPHLPHLGPPLADAHQRKFCGVVTRADIHKPLMSRHIVHVVRTLFALPPIRIVIHLDCGWAFLGVPFPTEIPKVPDEFLFLGVHVNDRMAGRLKRRGVVVNPLELGVTIRMIPSALVHLPQTLQAIPWLMQEILDGAGTNRVPKSASFHGQLDQPF